MSACAFAAHGEVVVDVVAGAAHDSNLTRAHDPRDRRSDVAFPFLLSVGHRAPLGRDGALTLAVEMQGEVHRRYRGLDYAGIAMRASYRHKFGLGVTAPYALVSASIAYDDYRDDVRDGHQLDLVAEIGKRIDESAEFGAGLTFDRRHARTDVPIVPGVSGEIFDLRGGGAYLRAAYAWNRSWLATGQLSVRRGDVESTSQRGKDIFLASDAIADDPAFNDPALFGYRLRGTTWSAGLALSRALDDRAAVDFGYLAERTQAAGDLEYRSRVLSLSYVHRF